MRAIALSEDRKESPLDSYANHFALHTDDGDFIGGASLAVVHWRQLSPQIREAFGAESSSRIAWLYGVGVLPAHRGQGHATQLVEHAMNLAASSFARQIALVARDPRLYERAGMQCVGPAFELTGKTTLTVFPMLRNFDVLELP